MINIVKTCHYYSSSL